MGLPENRVPLDPLVNHHYPYIPYSNYYFGAIHHLQTNPNAFDDFCRLTMFGMAHVTSIHQALRLQRRNPQTLWPRAPCRPYDKTSEFFSFQSGSNRQRPLALFGRCGSSLGFPLCVGLIWSLSVLEKKDLLETRTPSFFHACRIL
jgi:hypothetical protein